MNTLRALPFELIALVSVGVGKYDRWHTDRLAQKHRDRRAKDMKIVNTIASGHWMDGVKDVGSGT